MIFPSLPAGPIIGMVLMLVIIGGSFWSGDRYEYNRNVARVALQAQLDAKARAQAEAAEAAKDQGIADEYQAEIVRLRSANDKPVPPMRLCVQASTVPAAPREAVAGAPAQAPAPAGNGDPVLSGAVAGPDISIGLSDLAQMVEQLTVQVIALQEIRE